MDRNHGETGYCGQTAELRCGLAYRHMWEEPVLTGTNGSGTVFFSGCSLRCCFCQNEALNQKASGIPVTVEQLVEAYFRLEREGAHNINLVTAGHFLPQVRESIRTAKAKGLRIPFVYNCGGYEALDAIRSLEGLIDIYMPDDKYLDSETAEAYSHAPDYPEVAEAAIREMYRQTGPVQLDDNGLMRRGVLVRHLVLPEHIGASKKLIRKLLAAYEDRILLSVMSQYTPMGRFQEHPELERKLKRSEYKRIVDLLMEYPWDTVFIQEGKTAEESFIPDFDGSGFTNGTREEQEHE